MALVAGFTRAAKLGPESAMLLGALREDRGTYSKLVWHCHHAPGHVYAREATDCARAELRRRALNEVKEQ